MSKRMVAFIDDATDRGPTVQLVDDMLGELSLMPRDATIAELIDRLLDYRAAADESTEDCGSAQQPPPPSVQPFPVPVAALPRHNQSA